ncbi:very large secreted protein, signal peptide [Cryptosporidium felis]|nr:very large secreted protein, signal peptide [Cryptosporidium felis]
MGPLYLWRCFLFLVVLLSRTQKLVASHTESIFNFAASCLKHDKLGYKPPEFQSCSSGGLEVLEEACILDFLSWLESKEEEFVGRLDHMNRETPTGDIGQEEFGEVLNSTAVTSVLEKLRISQIASGRPDTRCPINCGREIAKVMTDLQLPTELMNNLLSFICESKTITMRSCLASVEQDFERFLDQSKQKNFQVNRSTVFKVCYNAEIILGRSRQYLAHVSDLLAFDFSLQEQLGISLPQLTRKSFSQLLFDPGLIYVFDYIRQVRLREVLGFERDSFPEISRGKTDPLELGSNRNDVQRFSFFECQLGGDLFLKLYLIPMQKSIYLCKLYFEYRGLGPVLERLPKDVISMEVEELGEVRKTTKATTEITLAEFGVKNQSFIHMARFNLFDCFDSLLDEKRSLGISTISRICYSIYRSRNKEVMELFDISAASFASIVMIWLAYAASVGSLHEMLPSEKEAYAKSFPGSVSYFLLMSISEGFEVGECKRHLEELNSHESFLSYDEVFSPEFPFIRFVNPGPINRSYVQEICNEKSILFQIFSQIHPLRDFLPETQPTKISFKILEVSDGSKGAPNLMGTKEIFDTTLHLYFAGDVPRGYLMNAVSFSLVGLRAFLRNTLTFLSQETIMAKYDEIQKGKIFFTPFSDVFSLMGISGSLNFLDSREQILFVNKYICSGSSENIDYRIKSSNLIKSTGSPFSPTSKETNYSGNMFSFVNCVDEFILLNWNNGRYSLLKSDPILFCAFIATYLARDFAFIQTEINKYAFYASYYEVTGNILPQKCMDVIFINLPYLKDIQEQNSLGGPLSRAFMDCVGKYSNLASFISRNELESFSRDFATKALEFVDRPIALHSSSVMRRILVYILDRHPRIGKEKILQILSALSPIYGFNYGQLISKLTENNIPLKESANIAGFVGTKLNGNSKKLAFDFLNWLEDHSGLYMPFENNPGLREEILNIFINTDKLNKEECIKRVNEIFEKFQIPADKNTNSICSEWRTLFENYPKKNSFQGYMEALVRSSEKGAEGEYKGVEKESEKEDLVLHVTRAHPIGISTKIITGLRDRPFVTVIPVLAERGLLNLEKETLQGFKTGSRVVLLDREKEMETTAEDFGLKDGDILELIVSDLNPESFEIKIIWRDLNSKEKGNFSVVTGDCSLGQFLQYLQRRDPLNSRVILSLSLPNGRVLEPQKENLDSKLFEYDIGTSFRTLELSSLMNGISTLNLKLFWRNPSILNVTPSIFDVDIKEEYLSREIQILSNENLDTLFNQAKLVLLEATFNKKDNPEVEKFEIQYFEVFDDGQPLNSEELGKVSKIIQNTPERRKESLLSLDIKDGDQLVAVLDIEPNKTLNIVLKGQDISYMAKLTSIPHSYKTGEPLFGLFNILSLILKDKVDLYDILVHEKYFVEAPDPLKSKKSYVNLLPIIKTFDSVRKLTQDSLILLSRKYLKKDSISVTVIPKEKPETGKIIKFKAAMPSRKVLDLLTKNFGDHPKPESLFTSDGKEIKLAGNNKHISFEDILTVDNVLYLTFVNSPTRDLADDQKKKVRDNKEISLERVKELLASFGFIVPNKERKSGIPSQDFISDYPSRFRDLSHIEAFVRALAPSINSERLINESQDYIFHPEYKFPSVIERLAPLMSEDSLGIPISNELVKRVQEYGFLKSEGDQFDFLSCIRSLRTLFFYYMPTKVLYSAKLYNICKKVGNFLFKKEEWLLEQAVNAAFIFTLEEHLSYPVDLEKGERYLRSLKNSILLREGCVEYSTKILSGLHLYSEKVPSLEIPISIPIERLCASIQFFVNSFDEKTQEYEKPVEVLQSNKLSRTIESDFPRFWEENTYGALLPTLSEVKYVIDPLFNFRNTFFFLKNHLEMHLKISREHYPNCILILTILIIRKIMLNSQIDPVIFIRKLVQFAIEEEYKNFGEINLSISEIMSLLEHNPSMFLDEETKKMGISWVIETAKENEGFLATELLARLKYSNKFLFVFESNENFCPLFEHHKEKTSNLNNDIQALIDYLTKNIEIVKNGSLKNKKLIERFKIKELISVSEKMDEFEAGQFYKVLREILIDIIKNSNEEMKRSIGYSNPGSFNQEFVTFIVAYKVISTLNKNVESNTIMVKFLKFFIYETFFNLGIMLGGIEINYITERMMERFDWNLMTIPRDHMSQILFEVSPINSAIFIDPQHHQGAIREISDLIIDILESKEPIKLGPAFRSLSTNYNLGQDLTPRKNLFKVFQNDSSMIDESNIEEINQQLVENGYPLSVMKAFNTHLKESLKILNNEIIHVGRIGKMVLSTRQQHIGAILFSYGYFNLQLSSLLKNFDHLHCFSSVMEAISDEPKRLDHYYQICMSICLEVDEIKHSECETLTIQAITSELLSQEKSFYLKRLISSLGFEYVLESDLKILREIYLDSNTGRTKEEWVNLFKKIKNYQHFYKMVKVVESHANKILGSKGLPEPTSGFAFVDVVGEFISVWTRENVESSIKKFLVKKKYPLRFFKYFSNIWPGDGRNRINLKLHIPGSRIIKILKNTLLEDLRKNTDGNDNHLEAFVENVIDELTQSFVGVSLRTNEIPSSIRKIRNIKIAEKGVDIEEIISKLEIDSANIQISLNECIKITNKEVKDPLDLSYSDILLFCIGIVNEVSFQKAPQNFGYSLNSLSHRETRFDLYHASVLYGLHNALSRIYQGLVSKHEISIYLMNMRQNLYLLNNEAGILKFVTGFIVKFRLPIDPNILSFYFKETILSSISGINSEKSDEIKIYQNVPQLFLLVKGFYKLVFEICKGLSDKTNTILEENRLKSLFQKKEILESIQRGFNPISVESFLRKVTNNVNRRSVFAFGQGLGMNSLAFKLSYIHKNILSKSTKILRDKTISVSERQFFSVITSNLTPTDRLIYELIYSSKENCIVEMVNKFTSNVKNTGFGPQFGYASKFCDEVLGILERLVKEIDYSFGQDYRGGLANCDRLRLENEIQTWRRELEVVLNYFNNQEIITAIFQQKQVKDLEIERKIQFAEKKFKKASRRSKYFRQFNSWNQPTNKEILDEINQRRRVFNQILSYLDNHIFVVIPLFRKILYLTKGEMNIINYQNIKKAISRSILTLGAITDPYLVPSIIKNNPKIKAEYSKEVNYFKRTASMQYEKEIWILGVNMGPYYLRICWFTKYLEIILQESNILFNQLPLMKIKKATKKKEKRSKFSISKFLKSKTKDRAKSTSGTSKKVISEKRKKNLGILQIIGKFFKKNSNNIN